MRLTISLICNSQDTGSDPSKISWTEELNLLWKQGSIAGNRRGIRPAIGYYRTNLGQHLA